MVVWWTYTGSDDAKGSDEQDVEVALLAEDRLVVEEALLAEVELVVEVAEVGLVGEVRSVRSRSCAQSGVWLSNVADCSGDLIFMRKLEYSFQNMFRQGLILSNFIRIPSNFVRIRFVDIGKNSSDSVYA